MRAFSFILSLFICCQTACFAQIMRTSTRRLSTDLRNNTVEEDGYLTQRRVVRTRKIGSITRSFEEYTSYPRIALDLFYAMVLEYRSASAKGKVVKEGLERIFVENPVIVPDLVGRFPPVGNFTIDAYLSDLDLKRPEMFSDKSGLISIKVSNIKIKDATIHRDSLVLVANYSVEIFRNGVAQYTGESEVIIDYPNQYDSYDFKIRQLKPTWHSPKSNVLKTDMRVEKLIAIARHSKQTMDFVKARQAYESLIELGYFDYKFDLAVIYANGFDIPEDPKKAYELVESMQQHNTPRGYGAMAWILYNGIYVNQDPQLSYQYAQKAASKDDAVGHTFVGIHLLNKKNANHSDTLMAINHLKKSCSCVSPYYLAYAELATIAKAQINYELCHSYLDQGIKEGDITCYELKGDMLRNGLGIKKSIGKAMDCYLRVDCHRTRFPYYQSTSNLFPSKVWEDAVSWYEKRYDEGDLERSSLALFLLYSQAAGARHRNYKRALDFLDRAIEVDNSGMIAYWGMEIYQGKHDLQLKDNDAAFSLALHALQKGVLEVNYDLATMYDAGLGVQEDEHKASDYYREYVNRKDLIRTWHGNTSEDRDSIRIKRIGHENYDEMLNHRYFLACQRLAASDLAEKKYVEAERFCKEILNLRPSSGFCYYLNGLFYSSKDNKLYYDKQRAIEMLNKAVELGYTDAKHRLRTLSSVRLRSHKNY